MVTVPPPPVPFDARAEILPEGWRLYRVGSNRRPAIAFNPGYGTSRFAFFGDPKVPVLYAADTEDAALAESLLHDVPVAGGLLTYDDYSDSVMVRLIVSRELRLASLRGLGLRQLKITAQQVTDTPASAYTETVRWAEAAHHAGFDGVAWTSRLCNDSRAVVLFGDRCANAVDLDESYARIFQPGADLDWLVDACAPLHVHVLPPPHF